MWGVLFIIMTALFSAGDAKVLAPLPAGHFIYFAGAPQLLFSAKICILITNHFTKPVKLKQDVGNRGAL